MSINNTREQFNNGLLGLPIKEGNIMDVKAIQKTLSKLGIKEASPDHPVYSTPLTVSFINRPRAATPAKVIDAEKLDDEH